MRLILRSFAIFTIALLGGVGAACAGRHDGPGPAVGLSGPSPSTSAAASQTASTPGLALNLTLDPVARDLEWHPASEQLRGKRAIVVAVTTDDGMSLVQLRELEPLFRTLPADVQCLLVAMQPLADRPIVEAYFDKAFDPTSGRPCLRAIGDPTRGRLGALSELTVVPTTIVVRADGTAIGATAGFVQLSIVRDALERAR
ncbi:MAG: hypothetical protein ACHREM_14260 [Polyangiales bacterium]